MSEQSVVNVSMDPAQRSSLASFIQSVADNTVCDLCVPGKCCEVGLPMSALHRPWCY